MQLSYAACRWVLAIPVLLSLTHCADSPPLEDRGAADELPQLTPPTPPAPTISDVSCTSDAECTGLTTSCARASCNQSAKKCQTIPAAAEGTACGTNNLCDNLGRCLPCGTAATSTFGLVQANIFDSTVHGCNSQVCHGSAPGQALLNLSAGASYAQMLSVDSTLSDMLRIRPGQPDESYVYRKMAWATTGTPVAGGSPMPAGGAAAVPLKLLQGMGDWIRAGAAERGFVPGTVAKLCEVPCSRDGECSNHNACDGLEVCVAGRCAPGKPPECDDGDACTADRCDVRVGCKSVRAPGLSCGTDGVCDASGSCKTCPAPAPTAEPTCELPPRVSGKLEPLWDFPLARASSSKPLVKDGVAYVTAWDGNLYALDAQTGKERWRLATGAPVIHGGVIEGTDGSLLFGDGAAMIWKVDISGKVLWKSNQQETNADHVWSNLAVHEDRVFVPLASHSDVPCTKGRTVALDLATGERVWSRYNVPRGGVCRTDTAKTCTTSAECPDDGACENAVGGAVTAGITVDPDGSLYVNTVGCYTFPQVGDTDAMMKLDWKSGDTKWIRHFSEPEQFKYCRGTGKDCRSNADCGENVVCEPKASFHDFGFINAPLLTTSSDGKGGTRRLVVNGNKSAGVYALDADTGAIVWHNQVLPLPVSPGFAGFGLFNGGFAHANGKFYGALYEVIPTLNPPDHLMAFSEVDGKIVWSDEIGRSWSSVTSHGGVVYAGTQVAPELYAYNAESGARLATYPMPANVAGYGTVVGDVLYIGYGVGGAGGVRAYTIK